MLQQTFLRSTSKYTDDKNLSDELWNEIEQSYSESNRHYHNLSHIEDLIKELSDVKEQIQDWDTMMFSVFYHDIIYNPKSKKNEEKSALLAKKRLQTIGFPEEKIGKCFEQIIATKSHNKNSDNDVNLLIDADLYILGKSREEYVIYTENIRKEYSHYKDFIYKKGRKKVLKHFLSMDRIYKTVHFYNRYEIKARINLSVELDLLN